MPALSLQHEVERLVLEQIRTLKQPAKMNDSEILEYHLRHCQIMALYHAMKRDAKAENAQGKGWLS
jgi:hypothetical protein